MNVWSTNVTKKEIVGFVVKMFFTWGLNKVKFSWAEFEPTTAHENSA